MSLLLRLIYLCKGVNGSGATLPTGTAPFSYSWSEIKWLVTKVILTVLNDFEIDEQHEIWLLDVDGCGAEMILPSHMPTLLFTYKLFNQSTKSEANYSTNQPKTRNERTNQPKAKRTNNQ